MDNITPITTKPDAIAASIEGLKRNLPYIIEYGVINARIKKAYFDALVKEGFSQEQALELAKVGNGQ